ncbi:hypothetical protein LJK87_16860 [Paenibacillus sp. P25]|nr:hypothetical protein LJK87_16860 [Paenibacillus sp. P25]
MRNAEVEPWVHQYVVTLHLLKALDRDRKLTEGMKLARIWDGLMEKLSMLAEREHIGVKQRLRRSGRRIVLEEVTPERNYHVMYVFQGYEFHCSMMPVVLKGKCEEKLRQLLLESEEKSTADISVGREAISRASAEYVKNRKENATVDGNRIL